MISCLLLIGSLLAGQNAATMDESLATDVRRLVRQLDAPQLAQREAAEAALLKRGPTILRLLPTDEQAASAEVRQRLGRIRQRLQLAAADSTAQASLITLKADEMPLSQILAAFQAQSGNAITDYRRQFSQPVTDPKLSIEFDKMPFWPALDKLLDRTGMTVYPYGKPQTLSVVAALGNKELPRFGRASYSGPFRFEAVWIRAHRNLAKADDRALVVTINAAWEPRLKIITLLDRAADIQAEDDLGRPLSVWNDSVQNEIPISTSGTGSPGKSNAAMVKLEPMFRLPPRDAQRIARLKGKLQATIAGKAETFRFDNLTRANNVQQRIAGVTVSVEQVRKSNKAASADGSHPNPLSKGEETLWEVRVHVRFDEAGDALASHRQWIFDNKAYLEGSDRKPIRYHSYETTLQTKNEVGIAYLFKTDRPLDECTFVYETPGTIINDSYEYELKDIPLP